MPPRDDHWLQPSLDERYDVHRMKEPMAPLPLWLGVLLGGFFFAGLAFGENFFRIGQKRAGILTLGVGLMLTIAVFWIGWSDLASLARGLDRAQPPTAAVTGPEKPTHPSTPHAPSGSGLAFYFGSHLVAFLACRPIVHYQQRFTRTWERSGRAPGEGAVRAVIVNAIYWVAWVQILREFAAL